ncbi:hypothetical protein D3C81_1840210 [compost metagenome]
MPTRYSVVYQGGRPSSCFSAAADDGSPPGAGGAIGCVVRSSGAEVRFEDALDDEAMAALDAGAPAESVLRAERAGGSGSSGLSFLMAAEINRRIVSDANPHAKARITEVLAESGSKMW